MKTGSIAGQKFGRLEALCPETSTRAGGKWICKCDCGNTISVKKYSLVSGNTSSCGCLHKELLAKSNSQLKKTHGLTGTRIYGVWQGMCRRCYEGTNKDYPRYGGRGISVCDDWKEDPAAFQKWASSNGYAKGLTIDRIDVNGNYEPNNCRWVSVREQNNNRRTCKFITYDGETKTVKQWADAVGISRPAMARRLNNGWPLEIALRR